MAWIDTGPPSKINPDVSKIIIDAIKKNAPYQVAAWMAKIHERTLYRWLVQGEKDLADGLITEYTELRHAIKAAEGEKITSHLQTVEDQTERWQARAWLLERRWREFFTDKAAEIDVYERLKVLEEKKGESQNGKE
jgi:hypothetical protein